ncbi:MAG: hypothetical protein ACRD44_12585 [Bryobacteraceae bacterium]
MTRTTSRRLGESGNHAAPVHALAPAGRWEGFLGNRGTAGALRQSSPDMLPGSAYPMNAYPHQSAIRHAFGFAVPGAAVVDPGTCATHGAQALTDGRVTRFATPAPSLKVAAHEAVHLAQHAGLTRDAGLGAERHAHTIATAMNMGAPVGQWIGNAGNAVAPAARAYSEVDVDAQSPGEWDAGLDLRVAEDGQMAVGQDNPMHHFWAGAAKIAESNRILGNIGSAIRLKEKAIKLKGTAPDGSAVRSLSKVLPDNVFNTSGGDSMEIWADCGRCARDVAGAGSGTGGGAMTALYQKQRRPWWTQIPVIGYLLAWIIGLPAPDKKQTAPSGDPEAMKKEIFKKRLGGTGDEALAKYMAMSAGDRERFDRETGINRYSKPETGEGYTTSSGGTPVGPKTWNFHWGGVVMTSAEDRVVLENYAVGDALAQNTDWEFQMYGSAAKRGQTFHEQHQATGQHGSDPTTMRVKKS